LTSPQHNTYSSSHTTTAAIYRYNIHIHYYEQLWKSLKRYGEEDEGPALAEDNASDRAAVYAHLHLDPEEALD